jgi:hypothetical protein
VAKKANDMAYSMLTMAVSDAVSFGAVYNAQTTDLPDGDSKAAWSNLEKIFKPIHSTKKYELEQAFNSCALLQESKNPDEWFAELQKIRLQLKIDFQVDYDDNKIISHMLFNIKPKGYDTIVAIIKRDLNKGVATTLDDVKEDIRQVYGQLNKGGSTTKEQALVTRDGKSFKKVFKGDCRVCGKKGHKATECWENEKNKDKRPYFYKPSTSPAFTPAPVTTAPTAPKSICSYCSKPGHTEDKCFKKKRETKSRSPEAAEVVVL